MVVIRRDKRQFQVIEQKTERGAPNLSVFERSFVIFLKWRNARDVSLNLFGV